MARPSSRRRGSREVVRDAARAHAGVRVDGGRALEDPAPLFDECQPRTSCSSATQRGAASLRTVVFAVEQGHLALHVVQSVGFQTTQLRRPALLEGAALGLEVRGEFPTVASAAASGLPTASAALAPRRGDSVGEARASARPASMTTRSRPARRRRLACGRSGLPWLWLDALWELWERAIDARSLTAPRWLVTCWLTAAAGICSYDRKSRPNQSCGPWDASCASVLHDARFSSRFYNFSL